MLFHANLSSGERHVFLADADGSNIRQLTDESQGWYAVWSSDGETIAYVNTYVQEGNGRIWLMNRDGSNKRPLRPPRD